MTLRNAKISDYWRTAGARNYSEKVDELSVQNSVALWDFTAKWGKGIIALVGGNGVGKSTLAHAIAEGLAMSSTGEINRQGDRLHGSTLSFSIIKDGVTHARRVTFGELDKEVDGDETLKCHWIDPSLFATRCLQQILGDATFDEILEGAAKRDLTPDEVALASYVIGKTYKSGAVWEVADYGPYDIWPYFQVETDGANYGSEAMGQGELALWSTIWSVSRCHANSTIVIEEPETHVSSRSQHALMDFFARESATKGISFLLTTHSASIAKMVAPENTFLLLSEGKKTRVAQQPRFHHLSSLLGGDASLKALLVVEDASAKIFCETLIQFAEPDLARQVTFAISQDGESEIVRILKTMPRVKGWGMMIGCFDGDLRQQHATLQTNWPYTFLPGNQPPDKIIREFFATCDKADILEELRVGNTDLLVAIAATEGSDHHDWAKNMSQALNIDIVDFTKCATRLWLLGNPQLSESFLVALKDSLNS